MGQQPMKAGRPRTRTALCGVLLCLFASHAAAQTADPDDDRILSPDAVAEDPAFAPEQMDQGSVEAPEEAAPDPAPEPEQVDELPVASPDAVTEDPAIAPEQISAPPALPPN